MRKWVRPNYLLALVAAVIYGIGLLIAIQRDPDRFPERWSRYGVGASHDYLILRAILVVAAAVLQGYLVAARNELAARAVAGMTGAWVLLYVVIVDSALNTMDVASPGGTGFLTYLSLSFAAFAFFGRSTRAPRPASFELVIEGSGPPRGGGAVRHRRQSGTGSLSRSLVESLVVRGHGQEAIALHEAEARERPDDPEPLREIARIERLELKRPERAIRALVEARKRADGDAEAEAHITRQIAEVYLHDLKRPRKAMPELARLSAKFRGSAHGEWARRELRELKTRLASGEMDAQATPMSVIPLDILKELDVLMRTRYGLIAIETDELDRVDPLLRQLSERRLLPLLRWSPTRGLHRDQQDGGVYGTEQPAAVLAHIAASDAHALYYLPSFAQYLEGNPALTHLLTDVAGHFAEAEGAIVIAGPELNLPDTVRGAAALLRLPAPKPAQYRALLDRVIEGLERRMKVTIDLDRQQQDALLMNLRGLTLTEAERLLTRMIVEDGRLGEGDLKRVVDAKRQVVEKEGLLEYYSLEATMDEIAGLEGLKQWLEQRRGILAEPQRAKEFGLDFPRGILLVGVPGSGKSLCAKAVAADWHLPLLKLDPGSLYNKFMGESERNFRRALGTAERMAPAVLWIDEIEKAFAAGDTDGGTSQRVLGSFLSWMQERRGDVFIVATANDIARLPAEFLRKGRFDEVFFVDLPDLEARAAIFDVHLRKRGQPTNPIDAEALAEATAGFSGAEIEQVVVAGLFTAFSSGQAITTESLLEEAAMTRPLSVTMAERVTALREWARGRTRMA